MITEQEAEQLRNKYFSNITPVTNNNTGGTVDERINRLRGLASAIDEEQPQPNYSALELPGVSPIPNILPTARKISDVAKNVWNDYKNAGQEIVQNVQEGGIRTNAGLDKMVYNNDIRGAGEFLRGAAQSGFGTSGPFVRAMFSPIVRTAEAVIPDVVKENLAKVPGANEAAIGAVSGAALGGPAGAVVGTGFGVLTAGANAAEKWLLQQPKIAQWANENPDVIPTIRNAFDVILAAGAEIGAEKVAGKGDVMHAPIEKAPGMIGENLMATGKATQIPQLLENAFISGKDLYDAIRSKSPEQVDRMLLKDYQKGVKPSTGGINTATQAENYNKNVLNAIKTIVENKPNLKILDEYGELTGKTPTTLKEFTQAIDQTKKNIFEKYDALAKQAGEKGVEVGLNGIVKDLDNVANNTVVKDLHPELANYAEQRAMALNKRGVYTTEEAQSAIENLNKSLEAFYKNPSYDSASKASIDALIANKLRVGLDDLIEKTASPGYQELKNKYGSLKAIEKDVVKRMVVDARKNNKGLIDFTDIMSASDIVRGISELSVGGLVKGVTMKGIAEWYKYINSPNTAIKHLFENAERYNITGGSPTTEQGKILPRTQSETTYKK